MYEYVRIYSGVLGMIWYLTDLSAGQPRPGSFRVSDAPILQSSLYTGYSHTNTAVVGHFPLEVTPSITYHTDTFCV